MKLNTNSQEKSQTPGKVLVNDSFINGTKVNVIYRENGILLENILKNYLKGLRNEKIL